MKIAYVTTYASDDIHAWSGSVYHVRRSLEMAGLEVAAVDRLREAGRLTGKLKELAYWHVLRRRFVRNRREAVLDAYARQVEEALEGMKADVVFSPGSVPVAHLKPGLPMVFWTDATFAGLTDFYALFTGLCRDSLRAGNLAEQRALDRCSLAIYASEWAARTALEHYRVDPAKVKVVPYGANLVRERSAEEIEESLAAREDSRCRLLFIGVEWERKGGAIALEAARVLNRRGLRTELHIVGCQPPGEVPDFVVRHGFVSKRSVEGSALLDRLLAESHFLIVPSRAECYGLVFAEASACGLPSLAASVGGIPTVVRDGVNGRLFPLEAGGEDYAEFIGRTMAARGDYEALCRGSWSEYKRRLNWSAAGAEVAGLLRGLVA